MALAVLLDLRSPGRSHACGPGFLTGRHGLAKDMIRRRGEADAQTDTRATLGHRRSTRSSRPAVVVKGQRASVKEHNRGSETDEQVRLRTTLVVTAGVVAVAAALHLADHAIRGEIVENHGLIPEWNHSGWPFRDVVTPFTASLTIPLVFLVGIVWTLRRRLWARFWLSWAIVAAAVVIVVHFVPGPRTETMGVIYRTYVRGGVGPVAGALALIVVAVILLGLAALIALALRARRVSGPG